MKKITEKMEQEICADLRAGLSTRKIQQKYDIASNTLSRIQKKNGLLRTKPKPPPVIPPDPDEDEPLDEDILSRWDSMTRPLRIMIRKKERRTGVYWWDGCKNTKISNVGMEKKNKQDIWIN